MHYYSEGFSDWPVLLASDAEGTQVFVHVIHYGNSDYRISDAWDADRGQSFMNRVLQCKSAEGFMDILEEVGPFLFHSSKKNEVEVEYAIEHFGELFAAPDAAKLQELFYFENPAMGYGPKASLERVVSQRSIPSSSEEFRKMFTDRLPSYVLVVESVAECVFLRNLVSLIARIGAVARENTDTWFSYPDLFALSGFGCKELYNERYAYYLPLGNGLYVPSKETERLEGAIIRKRVSERVPAAMIDSVREMNGGFEKSVPWCREEKPAVSVSGLNSFIVHGLEGLFEEGIPEDEFYARKDMDFLVVFAESKGYIEQEIEYLYDAVVRMLKGISRCWWFKMIGVRQEGYQTPVCESIVSRMFAAVLFANDLVPRVCKHCGNGIMDVRKHKKREFCSNSCRAAFTSAKKKDEPDD